MKNHLLIITIIAVSVLLKSETLFEVKDALNNPVLNVSTDGLRVMNEGDTLMVISSDAIRANIGVTNKGLSRAFSVTTTQSKGKGLINALEVNSGSATMTSPLGQYTDFSPKNIFLGLLAGQSTQPLGSDGVDNVFIGNYSGQTNSTGSFNVFIGNTAGNKNIDGYSNVFIGDRCAVENTSGSLNTFVGMWSGYSNLTSNSNTFYGMSSGYSNTTGNSNTYLGRGTGHYNNGSENCMVGHDAGAFSENSSKNVFIGTSAGLYELTADRNVIIGNDAGKGEYNNMGQHAYQNVIIGNDAAMYSKALMNNVIIGTEAAKGTDLDPVTGDYNTVVGSGAGFNMSSGQGNVFLGYRVGYNETGSNKLYIDNSNTSTPLIYGDFSTDELKINGSLSFPSSAAVNRFSIDGTMSSNSDTYVPTEKAVRTYVTANKDNLGNHTSTQNIRLNGYYLSNDGGNEGVYVDTEGDVGIGTNSPGSNRLKVTNSASGITGATGCFENTNSTGIGLAAFATSTDAAFYAEQKNTTSTTANIAKFASQFGGWSEKFIFRSTGRFYAPYLASGTGTYLQVTTGGEIVKISSSRKYKKDIENLTVDPSKFMKLQPVSFAWNEKSASEGKKDYGLIAEDVEKIDPLLAVYNEDGSIEGVDYQKVNIMLLKVVQEQQIAIEDMRKEIEKLKVKK